MQLKRVKINVDTARTLWGDLSSIAIQSLEDLIRRYWLSIAAGDLLYLDGKWYVTHSGLLGIARRKRCMGIQVRPAVGFCDPAGSRWAFRATVYKSQTCKGFVGYGDADPSNVSPLVHGAEMRVAETGRSTGPCARPTASASARSRKSARSPKRSVLPGVEEAAAADRSMGRMERTETTADLRFATGSAS